MIDFGVLKGTSGGEQTRFKPLLYDASGYAERASVTPGQTVRYHLEVISDQFTSRICQVFKVNYSSDGWTDDKNEIRKRLKITEVTDTAKEESSNGATR
jgi:hypothetical protein